MHALLPLHHRIYIVLRRRLLESAFDAAQALPGEHQLAAEFKVSRETVRRVLQRLARERLVHRRHGVGTFPALLRGDTANAKRTDSYYDFIAFSSHKFEDRVLEFAKITTPSEVLREGAAFTDTSLKISRLRRLNGRPAHIVDSYVPLDYAQYISRDSLGNKTVLEELQKHGIEAQTSEMWVGAVAADSLEAKQLRVDIGAPLVHAARVSRDAKGRAIEFSRFQSVADEFRYRFIFDRNSVWARVPGS